MAEMELEPVRSSNIAAIGYDPDDAVLGVEFLDGSYYEYYDVDQDLFDEFMVAPSKGSFLHRAIKEPGYDYERIY